MVLAQAVLRIVIDIVEEILRIFAGGIRRDQRFSAKIVQRRFDRCFPYPLHGESSSIASRDVGTLEEACGAKLMSRLNDIPAKIKRAWSP